MRMIDPLYISMCHSVFIPYVTYIISQSTLFRKVPISMCHSVFIFYVTYIISQSTQNDGAAFPVVEAASDDENG